MMTTMMYDFFILIFQIVHLVKATLPIKHWLKTGDSCCAWSPGIFRRKWS